MCRYRPTSAITLSSRRKKENDLRGNKLTENLVLNFNLPPLIVFRGTDLGTHQHGRDCYSHRLVCHDLAGAYTAPEPKSYILGVENVGIEHTVLEESVWGEGMWVGIHLLIV